MVSPEFVLAWDRHFATFHTWEACKRHSSIKKTGLNSTNLRRRRRLKRSSFLESQLRQAELTMAVPGGATSWDSAQLPAHPGTTVIQVSEPATMQLLKPAREGLALMGTPDSHARPTWLAPLNLSAATLGPNNPYTSQAGLSDAPLWFQAAVRLGTKFIRVAAAGIPQASSTFEPKCNSSQPSACCTACGKTHPALMDEYYFWIEDSSYYDEPEQVAEWGATGE